MSHISSQWLLVLAFGVLGIGALILGLVGQNWRRQGAIAVVLMTVASVAIWVLAVKVFIHGVVNVPPLLRFSLLGASLSFRIDRLSGVFLIIIPFVGLASLLYAVEFMAKCHPNRSPARYYPFALLLTATSIGVVTVSDLFFFFIFWEMMTLVSWVLVWFDRGDEKKVRAAWIYFVAAHAATVCILIAALIIYSKSGSFAFKDMPSAIGKMAKDSPIIGHLLMALFLIGFGTKAGMFPLGGWLPGAYSAAPSPASAAFANTMTKLGVYSIVRVFLQFTQVATFAVIWGVVVAVFGALSMFYGTLSAFREEDSKRLLSFHIIGQIGYMLLGVGISIFFISSNTLLAYLALIAALYHLVNNAIYKPLLFLNVGAAEYETGLTDLSKLGGLGSFMPVTMTAAIVASLSIAGIPPFSGFVSKWLVYQSAFGGGFRFPLFLFLGLVAMFISLVTLASFMKLVGTMFLGKLASGLKVTSDVPTSMMIPQVALSVVCILLGVVPLLLLTLLYGTARDVVSISVLPKYTDVFGASKLGVTLTSNEVVTVGIWNPAYMILALIICVVIAYGISRVGYSPSRQVESWYGGEEADADEVRFRAHGFCLPFKEAFSGMFPAIGIPKVSLFESVQRVLNLDVWLYRPVISWMGTVADRLSRTHTGIPQIYMIWQLVGMVIVFAILLTLAK
jgi:hydrogenase-4 component B